MGEMSRYDFRTTRLFVASPLAAGEQMPLDRDQANYLVNVLRMKPGASVLVFNGSDGEWRAELGIAGRKSAILSVIERTREQTPAGDLHYLFAPLKHARLDYMTQKVVELGASRLQPVMTRRTQAERLKLERMRANAIEAAEQCGILSIADIAAPVSFAAFTAGWDASRLLVFCDEDADVKDPVAALAAARDGGVVDQVPVSVLIGPEGGFAQEERDALLKLPNVVRLALGPRILRADTAAVAALTLVQSVLGDWR